MLTGSVSEGACKVASDNSILRPSLTRFEVARFDMIAPRNVSEGWCRDVFEISPHASLAQASCYAEY